MSKRASEARRERTRKPAYKRNIQPFAGSAKSGKCINPAARSIALDNIAKKEHKT